jgi:hypothetical protein
MGARLRRRLLADEDNDQNNRKRNKAKHNKATKQNYDQ